MLGPRLAGLGGPGGPGAREPGSRSTAARAGARSRLGRAPAVRRLPAWPARSARPALRKLSCCLAIPRPRHLVTLTRAGSGALGMAAPSGRTGV